MATAMSRAKTLLRMPQNQVMTGYTPTAKQYFVNAGAWTKTPKKGYVVYFYHASQGRVAHVGIVRSVGANSFTTVQGNTSGQAYDRNGGMVASHTYSFSAIGGRVNGFGIPNFAGAGVTADQFVQQAESFIGYEQKASNRDLDSFKGNAGNNNYQRFQRDVGAGNGDYWCEYFCSAIALYTCQKYSDQSSAPKPTAPTRDWLQLGDNGASVTTMQKMLIACGYSCGKAGADGDFGNGTLEALKKFQKANGLTVDGYYGKGSKAKLEAAYAAKTKKPTSNGKTGVTTTTLNVRIGAGTNHAKCKTFGPIGANQKVTILNTVKGDDGDTWYFVEYKGKKGYCCAKYVRV